VPIAVLNSDTSWLSINPSLTANDYCKWQMFAIARLFSFALDWLAPWLKVGGSHPRQFVQIIGE
jgi:hypothetical protein